MRGSATVVVPNQVVSTIAAMAAALGEDIVLAGGWAIACRLRMARTTTRPTEDIDIVLGPASRPARRALEAASAAQDDPRHPCRLVGLPLWVDLLGTDPEAHVPGGDGALVTDPDGLRLLTPPFADLLVRSAEPVVLDDDAGTRAIIRLPRAGALVAAKVGNLALEDRAREKRATDGEDVVRLLEAFGTLALLEDLAVATPGERADLAQRLRVIGSSAITAQARAAGHHVEAERTRAGVAELLKALDERVASA